MLHNDFSVLVPVHTYNNFTTD